MVQRIGEQEILSNLQAYFTMYMIRGVAAVSRTASWCNVL
jgi:hypothetical protein